MPASGIDRIGALPDEILHHLLSFLPAQQSVRTCVLSQRWRHLWRFTTGLRVVGVDRPGPVQELQMFMYHLLVLRGRTDLDTFEIEFSEFSPQEQPYVSLWVRFAMLCRARTLTVHLHRSTVEGWPFCPDFKLLVSPRLKTLDLYGVVLCRNDAEFSSCPALENLKISSSDIAVNLSFQSLKHLSITSCNVNLDDWPCVSAPCLVSLELDRVSDAALLFESMPLLETAFVNDPGNFCGVNDRHCSCCDDGSNQCLLLSAISNAKHLELMSSSPLFFSTRDFKRWPTFSNLKTFLLNDNWCRAPHFSAITWFLKYSPVLEKLTLLLFTKGREHKVEMKGYYCSMETSSAISKHLQIVEVKCRVVDERVLKVLKFLCTFNIRKLDWTFH